MERIFVDTHYFIAIIDVRDQWHRPANAFSKASRNSSYILTDSIIVETLNYFSAYRPSVKRFAIDVVREFSRQVNVEIIEQTWELVDSGLELYASRLDQGYSLTDCISMTVSRRLEVIGVLTHDDHFRQEGFQILL